MAIPDFQTLMLPLLKLISDGRAYSMGEATEKIAHQFSLSDQELAAMLPSGRAPLFYNRLAWAKTYLKRAGLIEQPRRGIFLISPSGRQLLAEGPQKIDLRLLQEMPGYANTSDPPELTSASDSTALTDSALVDVTPEEDLERAHAVLRRELAADLINNVKKCTPAFFESLVIQLLLKMGYGGSRQEAGRAVGRSGDGGIDGIINEDRLGLDAIYLQAKRWDGTVGRPEIQKFVGALAGQRASKGVFITTSVFTQEAKEYAERSQYRVVLIDGVRLSDLMIEHDLGVSVAATYQLKRIDSDFFDDE
ncbi:MAG: restriction endonuclease [Curvibacter sp.]|jgi:restriction system protein|nr:restriction endonuclease [Curvibacter sp.]